MATTTHEESWPPPFEDTDDCSQGFCSEYCRQWCYIIFPPPPPFFLSGDGDGEGSSSSGKTIFSPLVIAIIGVLASAFLLVTYYTIISKYCGGFTFLRRRRRGGAGAVAGEEEEDAAATPGGSRRYEAWHVPPSRGLDDALIGKIATCRFRRADGLVAGTDCLVCLGEFREEEDLRLLPKCSHAFHLQCIDTWLKSHANCPLCRSSIVAAPAAPPSEPPELASVDVPANELTMGEEEAGEGEAGEGDPGLGGGGDFLPKSSSDPSQGGGGFGASSEVEDVASCAAAIVVGIGGNGGRLRRSFSVDSSPGRRGGRIYIADVLRIDMEEAPFMVPAMSSSSTAATGSSSSSSSSWRFGGGGGGDRGNRGLHCVMSSVAMKRSSSSGGRFCFARSGEVRGGRGRSSILPM